MILKRKRSYLGRLAQGVQNNRTHPFHAGNKTNKAIALSPPLAGAASLRGVCPAFRLTEVIIIWAQEDKRTGFGPLENLWVLSQSNQEQTIPPQQEPSLRFISHELSTAISLMTQQKQFLKPD